METLQVMTAFPRSVREIAHVWIPLADGCKLAARIWLPDDAEEQPVPAILEYIPYRKNDGTAHARRADAPLLCRPRLRRRARRSCAAAATPRASSTTSTCRRSRTTALEVLAWLAAQPWCSGAVGIIGKSWGGFNGLQIAARRPPELKAVISVCSTDDRYADDVHYIGRLPAGARRCCSWASTMLAYNARAARPGRRRRALARDVARAPGAHPALRRGLGDAPAARRLLAARLGLRGLRRHHLPRLRRGRLGRRLHQRHPAPAGRAARPAQGADRSLGAPVSRTRACPGRRSASCRSACAGGTTGSRASRRGSWTSRCCASGCRRRSPRAPSTPSGRGAGSPSRPGPRRTSRRTPMPSTPAPLDADAGRPRRGSTAWAAGDAAATPGQWCPYGLPTDCPPDQRAEDGRSLTFTSAPLDAPMEILGFPEVTLTRGRGPPHRAAGGAAVRRGADGRLDAGHARHAQPDAPREPRAAPRRWSRARATR